MKKLALGALFVGLVAACGGGKDNGNKIVIVDMGSNVDAPPSLACNPIMQTGCKAGEKCTWIDDQANPSVGHIGCEPDGTVALDGACMRMAAGPMGYDNCAKGTVCLAAPGGSSTCKTICDPQAAAAMSGCDANHSCTNYADFFTSGGMTVAGVCDPACDPLTQDLKVGNKVACGSTMATMPNKGCYGYGDFSCAPAGDLTKTDRQMPNTNAAGNPYLNGCAPGFVPLVYDMSGSTKTLCTGLCAALETDNTAAHAGNAKGDATALGKLPADAMAVAAHSTCLATAKGSEASSVCKFMWPALVDSAGMPAPMTAYTDKLGYCVALAHYHYDDMMGNAMKPFPNCNTLPPRSAATTKNDDDAADWGCQKLANSMLTAQSGNVQAPALAPAMRDFRAPLSGEGALLRHRFN